MTINGKHDGQEQRRFSSSQADHEQRHNLARDGAGKQKVIERHEIDACGIEHQLN